jgi:hypothetical protein
MDKKTTHQIWIGCEVGAAMTSITSLVALSSPSEWVVLAIAVGGWIAIIGLVYHLGLFRAPFPIGTPVRSVLIISVITALMGWLGWEAWPRPHLSPLRVEFSKMNDTYDFTISNDTPHDLYDVEVRFDLGKKWVDKQVFLSELNSFRIDMPNAMRVIVQPDSPYALYRDRWVFGCHTNDFRTELILILRKMTRHQIEDVTLKRITTGHATVDAQVTFYTKEQPSYEFESTKDNLNGTIRDSLPIDLKRECKMAFYIYAPSQ